jgi:carboxyvinyl-carboxyphosphonate phosphorylmutase
LEGLKILDFSRILATFLEVLLLPDRGQMEPRSRGSKVNPTHEDDGKSGGSMRKTTRLKELILASEILVMPGAHDSLVARIVERAGFQAVTLGGYPATAALLGKPDVSLLTMTEMVEYTRRICGAVDIPVFTDGDTGYGNVTNVIRTVKEMERAGVAGMFIEDQVFPKRCGHMEGKQVIHAEEMVAKIKAALDARTDPDFIIMARTDALAVKGIDEAIHRGNLYRETGADLIFIEAPQTVEDMKRINREINAPTLANNVEGGKSPLLAAKELESIGYNVVVFPISSTYCIAKAVTDLMKELKERGTTEFFMDRMIPFSHFHQLVGLDDIRKKEEFYLGDLWRKISEGLI